MKSTPRLCVIYVGHGYCSLIEQEYGTKTKYASPENPQTNKTIEITHRVTGNLVHTYNLQENYVYDADPWMGILAASDFVVRRTYCRTRQKNAGLLVFG